VLQVTLLAVRLIPAGIVAAAGPSNPGIAIAMAFVIVIGFLFATLVVGAVAQAATVQAVSAVYLDRPITVKESYARVRGQVRQLVGVAISVGIRVILWSLLFIIPGIRAAIRYALALPATTLEDLERRMPWSAAAILPRAATRKSCWFISFSWC